MPSNTANTKQISGSHYRADYQHWDLVAESGMGYFDGQVSKYLSRWNKKNGLEDLEKARHFAEKYLEVLQAGIVRVSTRDKAHIQKLLDKFYQANQLSVQNWELEIFEILANSHEVSQIEKVIAILDFRIAEHKTK